MTCRRWWPGWPGCARWACAPRWTTSGPSTPRWPSCAGCRSTCSRWARQLVGRPAGRAAAADRRGGQPGRAAGRGDRRRGAGVVDAGRAGAPGPAAGTGRGSRWPARRRPSGSRRTSRSSRSAIVAEPVHLSAGRCGAAARGEVGRLVLHPARRLPGDRRRAVAGRRARRTPGCPGPARSAAGAPAGTAASRPRPRWTGRRARSGPSPGRRRARRWPSRRCRR